MDAKDLVRAFAKEKDIPLEEVTDFLKQFDKPTTIEELKALPKDMLAHFKWIGNLSNPLYGFIKNDMSPERNETVTLDSVARMIAHRKLEYSEPWHEDERKELEKIEQQVIELKFGSVKYDW